jgi:hypothetical protein
MGFADKGAEMREVAEISGEEGRPDSGLVA